MKYSELIQHREEILQNSSIIAIEDITLLFGEFYSINNKVPIKIEAISSAYKFGKEIDIVQEDGSLLGTICIVTENQIVPIEIYTENRYIAYLADASYTDYISDIHIIKYSYAIIERDKIYDYLKMSDFSPVWGGFVHSKGLTSSINCRKVDKNEIIAIGNLSYPTDLHKSNSINALLQPFVFERFLKKYHQIELLSDLDVVNQIRNLQENLYGISQLFSKLKSTEIDRIRFVMYNRIKHYDRITDCLRKIFSFKVEAEKIFHEIKKDNNPICDSSEFRKLMNLPDFNESSLKNCFRKNLINDAYKEFITDLTSYWIYRMRCSIAHKRIGEYIMTFDDEEFMVEFGEPLIDAVLLEILKKYAA